MNGLKAIELMKQGKIAYCEEDGYLFKIENEMVLWITEDSYKDGVGWVKAGSFDFVAEYEEYVEPIETGWEKVRQNDTYYFIDSDRIIENGIECGFKDDNIRYDGANYFSTKEKAKEIHFKQTLERKLQRFSDESGGVGIDWDDYEQDKYSICYKTVSNRLDFESDTSTRCFGKVYFISKEVCYQVIDIFHDDLIRYFTM